tara:strand:+ start:2817 stop:2984 length:168 start_codon:yes stop_codon:yes gene_type:complete
MAKNGCSLNLAMVITTHATDKRRTHIGKESRAWADAKVESNIESKFKGVGFINIQ